MVNTRKIDILIRYRHLLESNLIVTDDLLQWLKMKRVLPDFIFDDIKSISTPRERNKKLVTSVIDNGDVAFTKLVEGLIANGQPFLGELLESEDRKSSELTADSAERIVIDDEMLKKCPGIDKLRSDTRDKLKTYLQEILLKMYLNDKWKSQDQNRSVEVIHLKRQHYENQQKLVDAIEDEKRNVNSLKQSLRNEQMARQQKEEEVKDMRSEISRIQTDFEQKLSSQIKMMDANNRSVFKMNDKMAVLGEWFRMLDTTLKLNVPHNTLESDSIEQLHGKLKRYSTEIELLRNRGIGTDKLKEELYESLYTSRYIPIDDRKNRTFRDLLVRLYGSDQVVELSTICSKDILQMKMDRDHATEIRVRDNKIEELNRLNRDLQSELERLKTRSVSPTEQITVKPSKPQWRPVAAAASVAVASREKSKNRQTLKPVSVQFGSKPGANL